MRRGVELACPSGSRSGVGTGRAGWGGGRKRVWIGRLADWLAGAGLLLNFVLDVCDLKCAADGTLREQGGGMGSQEWRGGIPGEIPTPLESSPKPPALC